MTSAKRLRRSRTLRSTAQRFLTVPARATWRSAVTTATCTSIELMKRLTSITYTLLTTAAPVLSTRSTGPRTASISVRIQEKTRSCTSTLSTKSLTHTRRVFRTFHRMFMGHINYYLRKRSPRHQASRLRELSPACENSGFTRRQDSLDG